jgi:hypothetical protein
MASLVYVLAIVSGLVGALGLVVSFITEESDGFKFLAHVVRSVGFLLLAILLKSFAG